MQLKCTKKLAKILDKIFEYVTPVLYLLKWYMVK